MEICEGKEGGERHFFNLLWLRFASAASHSRINCTSLSGTGKVHCLLPYLIPKPFNIETISSKDKYMDWCTHVSWTFRLEELVSRHKQLYLHPATKEGPIVAKKNVILWPSAFPQFVHAVPLLGVPVIHLFSVLSVTVPSNSLPPGTELLLRLDGRISKRDSWTSVPTGHHKWSVSWDLSNTITTKFQWKHL